MPLNYDPQFLSNLTAVFVDNCIGDRKYYKQSLLFRSTDRAKRQITVFPAHPN